MKMSTFYEIPIGFPFNEDFFFVNEKFYDIWMCCICNKPSYKSPNESWDTEA